MMGVGLPDALHSMAGFPNERFRERLGRVLIGPSRGYPGHAVVIADSPINALGHICA